MFTREQGCVECLAPPSLSVYRRFAIFGLLVSGKGQRPSELDREQGTRVSEQVSVGKRALVAPGPTGLSPAFVQRAPAALSGNRASDVAAPKSGIDRPGFIDHSD